MNKVMIFDTDLNTDYYKRKILSKENKIIKKYSPTDFNGNITDGCTGLGYNSLTSRFYHFNVLKWWGTKSLRKIIKKNYQEYFQSNISPIYVQCWANVMRRGQQIKPHFHRSIELVKYYSSLSGNIVINVDEESYTFYENSPILNKNGRMVLFPSNVVHSTSLYNGKSERVTIAFDICNYKDWKENVFEVFDNYKSHWIKI